MRSLVVEDDFICRRVLTAMLAPYGQCDVAVDGQEALEAYRLSVQSNQVSYDLICLDVFMPKKNGQDTLMDIRSLEEFLMIDPVKILMTTGGSFSNGKVEAFKLQCDGYLIKPIQQDQLIEHLKRMRLI